MQRLAISMLMLLGLGHAVSADESPIRASYLRCEYKVDPLGIDQLQPRLSWVVESPRRGEKQTAYQVLVATSRDGLQADRGDAWDSGRVPGDETTAVPYAGKPLTSSTRYYWKVKVWDKSGLSSPWSKGALWSMGLLEPSDWNAQWIGCDKTKQDRPQEQDSSAKKGKTKPETIFLPPAPYLRTTFRVEKPIHAATLYATALGVYDLFLNGHRVADEYFNPGWTDYAKRVYYRTYDVKDMLRQGDNAWGAIVGDGWFSGYVGWGGRDHYGRQARFRGQLVIEYADGTKEVVATGRAWKASTGAVVAADSLMGESCDARLEPRGWSEPGFDDANWAPVDTGSSRNPLVQAHPGSPVRVYAEFRANKIAEPKPGSYVLDFGQNFAGIARLTVSGVAGQKITLRFAERLNPDGTIYTANLRRARATDTYVCRGEGTEVWQPRFTFHGFQYVEATGLTTPPTHDTVVGLALSSDTPVVGRFECNDPLVNQLHRNGYYTQRSNFIDIPTDCPQRDERLGWTGDAQIYVRTAALNTDVHTFFAKWLVDLEDSQRKDGQLPCVAPLALGQNDGGPGWSDAGTICPWAIYQVFGDRRVLQRHYDSMVRFVEFCRNRSTPELLPPRKFHCFGDWLNIKAQTPNEVIYTAYFAHSADLAARTAEVLGKREDAAHYRDLFQKIKAAFNGAYVAKDGRIKGDTQTCYIMAIAFDLLDPEKAKLAGKYLVEDIEKRDGHLSTGFLGTKDLMLALSKIGRNDVAYRLLDCDTFPSWGFSIKHGATSIWERWDGWTPDKGFQDAGMNSFAHYSFGAVYQWMVENIGGIRSDGPAYKQIVIAPQPGGHLTWAKVGYRSIRGQIESDWRLEGGRLLLDVVIPANTSATVLLPTTKASEITESGRRLSDAEGVKFLRMDGNRAALAVESGTYHFVSPQ